MRADVQLRRLVRVNPLTPEFARATGEVTFVPLECVWPRGQADFTRRAEVESVANGYTRFRKGDVLLPKVTPTFQAGRATVATIDTSLGAASTEVHILRETARSSARYMAYLGQSRRFISEGETVVEGVGNLLRVPTDWVKAFRVPLLSRQGQEAIADFLDRETAQIDAMIEANEAMIASLEERRTAALAAVLLPQVAKPADGSDRWFGSVEWDAPKLRRHAKITNGSTPRREREDYWGGDFPWLNSSVVNQDTVTVADQFVTQIALTECHLPKVPVGSVLIGLTGQGKTRGKATEVRLHATINQHVAAIIPDNTYWDSRFLTLLLRTAYDELRRISDANGATKGALTCEALAAFRVPMPPTPVQRSLAAQADAATAHTDALVAAAMDVSHLLRERRDALITAAVTGRINPETGVERSDPTTEKEAS
ncbi:restriction endonuclease subunit S [Propioniciclava soli]|uniref:Restriction endonuclease subunit S n=1 Tax=Propioniciclava soli TaxID=2775081 RepID=A0ABZ3CBE2_9ACTN